MNDNNSCSYNLILNKSETFNNIYNILQSIMTDLSKITGGRIIQSKPGKYYTVGFSRYDPTYVPPSVVRKAQSQDYLALEQASNGPKIKNSIIPIVITIIIFLFIIGVIIIIAIWYFSKQKKNVSGGSESDTNGGAGGLNSSCSVPNDCSDGFICENSICKTSPGSQCMADSDCMEDYICTNTPDGQKKCLGYVGSICNSSANCINPLSCRNGSCQYVTCVTDIDCSPDRSCISGICYSDYGEVCNSTEGCDKILIAQPNAGHRTCNTSNECVGLGGATCSLNSECNSNICISGICGCNSNADCYGSSVCNTSTNLCQGPSGYFCTVSGECNSGVCINFGSQNICGCNTVADCPDGNICSSNICQGPSDSPCTYAAQCINGSCIGGRCSCNVTTDCPAGKICNISVHRCE